MDFLPPHHHLLTTNQPPANPSEYEQVIAATESVSSQLQAMDAKIARLQAELAQITSDRDKVQEQADQYRGVLSPLRLFPPEILSTIFLFCCPPFSQMFTSEPPLALGRVCSAWRTISLQTPALWNSLMMSIPAPIDHEDYWTVKNLRKLEFAWEQWIARAGDLPLDLSISFPVTSDQEYEIELVNFCRIFLTYHARWRHIEITMPVAPGNRFLSLFTTLDGPSVPNLEFFKISPSRNSTVIVGEPLPPSFAFLLTAPQLLGLSFYFTLPPRSAINTEFTHARLSLLEISEPMAVPLQIILDIAAGCPTLKELRLANTLTNLEDQALGSFEEVSLPHLTHLQLSLPSDRSQPCLISLLETLHLPSLESLAIRGVPAQATAVDRPLSPALYSLLDRSKCALQDLQMYHCRNEPVGIFLDCLIATSASLQNLYIREAITQPSSTVETTEESIALFNEEVLSALTSTSDVLCPNLRSIRFVLHPETPASFVLDFFRARAAAGLLEHAWVYTSGIDPAIAEEVVNIRPDGYHLFSSHDPALTCLCHPETEEY